MSFADKIRNLPPNIQEFLSSNEPRIAKERACFLYDLQEEDVAEITPITRGIYLGEVQLADLPLSMAGALRVDSAVAYGIAYELAERTYAKFPEHFKSAPELVAKWKASKLAPLISEEKAWRRVLDIEPWIEEEEREKKRQAAEEAEKARKESARLERLSLAEGMQKYPQLGEQAITSSPITLKYFASPVRPSVKNWISDYQDSAGAGERSAVQRSSYLFSSANTKRLTSAERERLGAVLRSLDDKSPLPIDPDTGRISFEAISKESAAKPAEARTALRATVVRSEPHSSQAASQQSVSRGVYEEPEDIFARYASRVGKVSASFPAGSSVQPPRAAADGLSRIRPVSAPMQSTKPAEQENFAVRPKRQQFTQQPAMNTERPRQPQGASLENANRRIADAARHISTSSFTPENLPFAQDEAWQIKPPKTDSRPEGMARMREMGAGKLGFTSLKGAGNEAAFKAPKEEPLQKFGAERISDSPAGAQSEESSRPADEGLLRFSSPQTLPVEKRSRPDAQVIAAPKFSFDEQNASRRNRQLDNSLVANGNQRSAKNNFMRITPHAFMRDEDMPQPREKSAPRLDGNVVDLKSPSEEGEK